MIPGYIDRWRIEAMRSVNKPTHERGFLLVFHGNHPGTHHLYVKHHARVRTQILDAFSGIPDCSVGGPVQDFFDRMGRSHFCLVPRGSSAWTIHLYESFFFGCIPVILSDEFEMPFQDLVDWPKLSIKWPTDQIGPALLDHLRSIPLSRVADMKRQLELASCYFDYHRGWGQPVDGTWVSWGTDVVALGPDCPFKGHGSSETPSACQQSCASSASCNLVNYLPPSGAQGTTGDCVLRSCVDSAQPGLTGSVDGWEVWTMVKKEEHSCSPYAAILRKLGERAAAMPFTHGAHWS